MSTRQSYDYTASLAEMRCATELAQRRLHLERQRAEAAAISYRQSLDRLRELGGREAALAGELSGARQDLARLTREAEASRAALAAAEGAVLGELARAQRLTAEIDAETAALAGAIGAAEAALEEVAGAGRTTAESIAALSPAERETMAARQRDLEAGIHRLEGEVRLLGHDQATAPAAMMALLAMEANGYRLRETVSAEGLVAYFAREGANHQIAVRTRPAARNAMADARWEVTAETFGLTGESCLFEIEDFETAVEDLDLGVLAPGDRVYPKSEPGSVTLGRTATGRAAAPLPPPRRDPAGARAASRRKLVDRG